MFARGEKRLVRQLGVRGCTATHRCIHVSLHHRVQRKQVVFDSLRDANVVDGRLFQNLAPHEALRHFACVIVFFRAEKEVVGVRLVGDNPNVLRYRRYTSKRMLKLEIDKEIELICFRAYLSCRFVSKPAVDNEESHSATITVQANFLANES